MLPFAPILSAVALNLDQLFVLGVLGLALILFVTNWVRFDVVGVLIFVCLVSSSLLGLDVITPEQALQGFANEAVLVIACLFVITRGLQKTGFADMASVQLQRIGGGNEKVIFVILVVVVGLLSAVVNNTAVTAMAIPMVLRCYDRLGRNPSEVYLPLAYISLIGGTMTLIGTSTNVAINSELKNLGKDGIRMFEMTVPGAIFTVVGAVVLLVTRRWFLGRKPSESLFGKYNVKEFLSEILVRIDSEIIGKPLQELHFGHEYDITIIGIVRDGKTLFSPPPTLTIRENDVLMVQGGVENIISLRKEKKLQLLNELRIEEGTLRSIDLVMAELVLLPNNEFSGQTIREIDLRDDYGVTILALSRSGLKRVQNMADIPLHMGDTLLIQGHPSGIRRLKRARNVLVLETIERTLSSRRLPVAVAIVLAMVICSSFPNSILFLNCLLAVLAMLATRCIRLKDVYESVDWRILVLIAGVLPLGRALNNTQVLEPFIQALPKDHEYLTFGALYLMTWVLTQLISNVATAALMTPVAVQLASFMNLGERPFVMGVAFAASFAFVTPVGHQACTLVMGPGNYSPRDYMRQGTVLGLVLFLVALWVIPWWFPFVPAD